MSDLFGHCFCGAVTFAVSGRPLKVTHCHCESCRRATSSPVTTFLVVRRPDFRYTQGAPKTYASSLGVRRSFCDQCGSPLAYETDERPDQIDLYVCSLAEPATVVPQAHVHAQEQLPWLEILDDLPRYARSSRADAPIRHGPRPTQSP
jgi:hypothetical protein